MICVFEIKMKDPSPRSEYILAKDISEAFKAAPEVLEKCKKGSKFPQYFELIGINKVCEIFEA